MPTLSRTLLLALMAALIGDAALAEPYVRLGVGADGSLPATFGDRDCDAVAPPALFGCGDGRNGEPLQATGSFGTSVGLDAGVGYRFNSWLRGEALLNYRPSYQYSGQANFLGGGSPQPLEADLSSVAGFGVGYVDLPRLGRVQPYLGAGVGVARNRISSVEYRFPSLPGDASTTIAGGTHTGVAWLLTAGLAVPLRERLSMDLAYRYTDLGRVQTDAGNATIERATGRRSLEIAGTQSSLQTHGVMLSLRYAFR